MTFPVQSPLTPRVLGLPHGCRLNDMKNHMPFRQYYVVVTDPEADWRTEYVTVSARSREEAREVARGALREKRCDHWSVEVVVEAA